MIFIESSSSCESINKARGLLLSMYVDVKALTRLKKKKLMPHEFPEKRSHRHAGSELDPARLGVWAMLALAEQGVAYRAYSLVDSGNNNNNNLATLARANFPPYGVDFPGGATGRFTNGRTTADRCPRSTFGFQHQPFANISRHFLLQGVNYASAAGGIRNETGQQLVIDRI
ncbi:hypothetical protein LguiA_025018 [Lonicera macranthoides]